jgi:hypothetical protein
MPPPPQPTGAAHELLKPVGARSGLPWNSGIFPIGRVPGAPSYAGALKASSTARGRRSDIEQAAQWNDDWLALTGMQVLTFMNPAIVASVGLPPFPPGGTWAAAAGGTYDRYYREIGARIAALRTGATTDIRFAWEFNIIEAQWHATDAFVAGWRRAVSEIRAGAGRRADTISFSWCLSDLNTTAGYQPLTQLWPGDAYVDIVGLDVYDMPATTNTAFPAGRELDTLSGFAADHGKAFAIEEWGLHHTGVPGEGGDDPTFIHDMFRWIKQHRTGLLYEQYFQDDLPGNVRSSLFSATGARLNPRSRAAYLAEIHDAG